MGLFSKETEIPVEVSLPVHEFRSSYGIIDCPKCARYIHVTYHHKCGAGDIQHLHCRCSCGYEFINKVNDADRYKFQ